MKKAVKLEFALNCYVLISGRWKDHDRDEEFAEVVTSFFYDGGAVGIEWNPPYGPVQRWIPCDEKAEGARPHYFYDFENTAPASFSQIAVSKNGLPQALARDDFSYIFGVLERWTDDY